MDARQQRLHDLLAQAEAAENALRTFRQELARELTEAPPAPAPALAPTAAPVPAPAVASTRPVFVAPTATGASRPAAPATLPSSPPPKIATPPSRPAPARDSWDWSSLLGARTLAYAGGVIFLLGIFFFLALAIQRGWLSETARCLLGAATSAGLIGAAFALRNRFGGLAAAQAAAGAGIAGLYGSLLAATSLYALVGVEIALVLSLVVGVIAVAVALAFNAQALAVLGLVASLLGPLLLGIRPDGATIGALLSACVVAAVLGVHRRWSWLLVLAPLLAWPQVFTWLGDQRNWTPYSDGSAPSYSFGVVVVALFFGAVAYAAGVAWELRRRQDASLSWLGTGLLTVAGLWWLQISFKVLDSTWLGIDSESWAAVGVALVFLLTPLAVKNWRPSRNLATLCWTSALVALFVALSSALGDREEAFVAALAVKAAVLVYLSRVSQEVRLQYAAAVLLGIAGMGLLALAPPFVLFWKDSVWGWEWAVAAVFAFSAGSFWWTPKTQLRSTMLWVAGIAGVYAGSLAIMTLLGPSAAEAEAMRYGEIQTGSFQLAHTLLSAFWGLVGLGCLYVGLRWSQHGQHIRWAGLGLLAVAVIKLLLYDLAALDTAARAGSFLVLGLVLLVAGFYYQRLTTQREELAEETLTPAPEPEPPAPPLPPQQ